tara:strand:- start:780 stop:1196 length:417 start_codon:yes stop_codon:yes gene_type:complete
MTTVILKKKTSKAQLKKELTSAVNRLVYMLDMKATASHVGTEYLQLCKEQAKSDFQFFGTGSVASQTKFSFMESLLSALEDENRFDMKSLVYCVKHATFAQSLVLNFRELIKEELRETGFPVQDFKTYQYRDLYSELY